LFCKWFAVAICLHRQFPPQYTWIIRFLCIYLVFLFCSAFKFDKSVLFQCFTYNRIYLVFVCCIFGVYLFCYFISIIWLHHIWYFLVTWKIEAMLLFLMNFSYFPHSLAMYYWDAKYMIMVITGTWDTYLQFSLQSFWVLITLFGNEF
jgi:hypothetical protein